MIPCARADLCRRRLAAHEDAPRRPLAGVTTYEEGSSGRVQAIATRRLRDQPETPTLGRSVLSFSTKRGHASRTRPSGIPKCSSTPTFTAIASARAVPSPGASAAAPVAARTSDRAQLRTIGRILQHFLQDRNGLLRVHVSGKFIIHLDASY